MGLPFTACADTKDKDENTNTNQMQIQNTKIKMWVYLDMIATQAKACSQWQKQIQRCGNKLEWSIVDSV